MSKLVANAILVRMARVAPDQPPPGFVLAPCSFIFATIDPASTTPLGLTLIFGAGWYRRAADIALLGCAAVRGLPLFIAASALVTVAVSGCKPAFDVQLASSDQTLPDPAFVVRSRDNPQARPEYHTVRVIRRSTGTLVWHLRAKPFNKEASQSSLRYGVTPVGFEAVVPAAELQPGAEYSLVISGTAHGELRFTTDPKGRLSVPD